MSIVRASSNPRCPADVIGALLDKSDDSGELAQYREVVAQPRLSVEYILVTRNRIAKVPKRLEDTLGVGRHFDDQRHAKQFFSEPANINEKMENIVRSLLPPFVP